MRNQSKIRCTVSNAHAFLEIENEGNFSDYLWSFVGGIPIVNEAGSELDYRATSPESDNMSKALKKELKFAGSTICYAFMQAVGMVNDHIVEYPRWQELRS